MKKLLIMIFLATVLTACGNDSQDKNNDNSSSENSTQNDNQKVDEEESKYPFPEDSEQVGNATVTITTASGSSEDGNVPVLIVQQDTLMEQIGMDLANFQGDKQTFVYADKRFVQAEQVGELTQTSLDVEGNLLDTGTHTVTAVQFEGDDPNGKVINYTEAKFEVKEGAS
ncbi:hypothetical protein [Niallia sp. BSM11]|uniref:hypothetical protein n=1 Tax=Niallia sp. BSM11 TaxID=3391576 RepID=UPI0039854326